MASEACIATLKAVREYIADPKRWCQGRPRDGEKRCAWAALHDMASPLHVFHEAYSIMEKLTGGKTITKLNDTSTHAEVLAFVDQAIAVAEGTSAV